MSLTEFIQKFTGKEPTASQKKMLEWVQKFKDSPTFRLAIIVPRRNDWPVVQYLEALRKQEESQQMHCPVCETFIELKHDYLYCSCGWTEEDEDDKAKDARQKRRTSRDRD